MWMSLSGIHDSVSILKVSPTTFNDKSYENTTCQMSCCFVSHRVVVIIFYPSFSEFFMCLYCPKPVTWKVSLGYTSLCLTNECKMVKIILKQCNINFKMWWFPWPFLVKSTIYFFGWWVKLQREDFSEYFIVHIAIQRKCCLNGAKDSVPHYMSVSTHLCGAHKSQYLMPQQLQS